MEIQMRSLVGESGEDVHSKKIGPGRGKSLLEEPDSFSRSADQDDDGRGSSCLSGVVRVVKRVVVKHCKCLHLDDEDNLGLLARDAIGEEEHKGTRHGRKMSRVETFAKAGKNRLKKSFGQNQQTDDDEDEAACSELARLLVASGVAAKRPSGAGASASDYIDVLTVMASRLGGGVQPKGFGVRVRQAVQLFGRGDVGMHLHMLFKRTPQIIQFFLPQLLLMSMLRTKDREALELFVLQVCRRSVYFALLCWWFLEAQGGDTHPHTKKQKRKWRKQMGSRGTGFLSFLRSEKSAQEDLMPDEALQGELRRRLMDILSGARYMRRAKDKQASIAGMPPLGGHIAAPAPLSWSTPTNGPQRLPQDGEKITPTPRPVANSKDGVLSPPRPGQSWGHLPSEDELMRPDMMQPEEPSNGEAPLILLAPSTANSIDTNVQLPRDTGSERGRTHGRKGSGSAGKKTGEVRRALLLEKREGQRNDGIKGMPPKEPPEVIKESETDGYGAASDGETSVSPPRSPYRHGRGSGSAQRAHDDDGETNLINLQMPKARVSPRPKQRRRSSDGGLAKHISASVRDTFEDVNDRVSEAAKKGFNRLQLMPKEIKAMSHKAIEGAKGALGQKRTAEETAELLWKEEEAFLDLPKRYFNFLREEAGFVKRLIQISQDLIVVPVEQRLGHLKQELAKINNDLPAPVFLPLCTATQEMCGVLNILVDEAFVFSTRERAPFKMCVEVLGTSQRWSSSKLGLGPYNIKLPGVFKSREWTQSAESHGFAESDSEAEIQSTQFSEAGAGSRPAGAGMEGMDNSPSVSKGPMSDEQPKITVEQPGCASNLFQGDVFHSPHALDTEVDTDAHLTYDEHVMGDVETAAPAERDTDAEEGLEQVDLLLSKLRVADCKQLVADRDQLGGAVGENWRHAQKRIREASPYGNLPHWKLLQCIVKSNDDVRQEQFATQLITLFYQIFRKAGLSLWLRPYQVLATSFDSGLIEMVPDTCSLHGLKKQMLKLIEQQRAKGGTPRTSTPTLSDWFTQRFGKNQEALRAAKRRFAQSLAAYAVVCYILQIKDRHNGNILVEQTGRVVHIDFGFMLSNSPGMINFEKAAFKLTREMVDVMGGETSELFADFQRWCIAGYMEARAHARQILILVEITLMGQPDLPCFQGRNVLEDLEDRFKLNLSSKQATAHFQNLLTDALDNWYTRQYDKFQRITNGILE